MLDSHTRVVVIGGAVAAELERVIAGVPERTKLALVAHCTDPKIHEVAERAAVRVAAVSTHAAIEPATLYVVPTDREVEIRERALVIGPKTEANSTLDVLMRSCAGQFGTQSIGVLLSHASANGALGLKRIKEAGGITIALAGDADLDATQTADLVLTLGEIAARLQALGEGPGEDKSDERAPDVAVDTLRDILALLRVRSGHDFSSYKRATLFRRVSRRMQVCQVHTIAEYHQYLREHPHELTSLLRDFLISVTNFFRDGDAFGALASEIVAKVFAHKEPGEHVRVWVPGCASGEEVYSLAMLLAEYADAHQAPRSIQVFATDIDEQALAEARDGRYPETIAVDVGSERLQRFFTRQNGHYRVNEELRELVLFSPHNLLRDPPFSRLDLVSCRNLLIYLNREAQDRVLRVFHFALRSDGYLFLGSSESAENSSLFSVVDSKARIYQRRLAALTHGLDTLLTGGRRHTPAITRPPAPSADQPLSAGELHFRAVERYAPPSVLVDSELDLVHVSEHAGRFLEMRGGEPTRQLLRLVLPPLRLDLRTAIHAARQTPHGTDTRLVHFEEAGKPRTIELRVVANQRNGRGHGTLLVFFDEKEQAERTTVTHSDAAAVEPLLHEIEDELQRTRDQLRTTIEQYETSLEELEASNEELQAINEELRSATEELETSREELQSVNEELTMLNHELKVKIEEVSHANSDLQNLMSSTDIGVLFLDRHLHIKRFTPRAQELFSVIGSDIGRPLGHLTHTLELDDLSALAHDVLQTLRMEEREVPSTNGKRYLLRLLPYRSLDDRIEGVVVTFVDITALHAAVQARRDSEAALEASEQRLRLALAANTGVMFGVGSDGRPTWGFAIGKQLDEQTRGTLFTPGDAERFATIARGVLESHQPERVELPLAIDGTTRRYELRFEPSTAGVNVVGVELTAGASRRA